MPDTVSFDSMICVWGIKKIASTGQEHKIGQAEGLIETLTKDGSLLLLPAPIITELVCPVPPKERGKLIDSISKWFRIVPVDAQIAIKAGELWHDNKGAWQEIYKDKGPDGLKNRFKFDLLVAATGIVRKVDILYTEDEALANICKKYINVGPMPVIGTAAQLDMFGKKTK